MKSKPWEGKEVVCAVLRVALASALQECAARSHQGPAVIKSLQVQVQFLQAQVANLEGQLGKKRNQNSTLIEVMLIREPRVLTAARACLGHISVALTG